VHEELERARSCCQRRKWADAYEAFLLAEQVARLEAEDLEKLAISAYLIGRDDEYLAALERLYHLRFDAGERRLAVRCAFWIGLRLLFRGEAGRASGWLVRAERLLKPSERDCAEWGYLLLPVAEQRLASGDAEAAHDAAITAAEIGESCREPDLTACARHLQAKVLIRQGKVARGIDLLDEVMVSVAAGELSPIMAGLLYCSVVDLYEEVYALERAREWTSALSRWCEEQPQMVAFTGICEVHRAEIMQRHGAWRDAIEQAGRAGERSKGVNRQAAAAAFYQQAEMHRLRGEFAAAETGFRRASRLGMEPQPGLALLRLAQGRLDLAVAGISRSMTAVIEPLPRTRLLPAYVEIMLAAGETQDAHDACGELEQIAASTGARILGAMAAQARGAVELAKGDARIALASLRRALDVWLEAEMPYAAARVRTLAALGCRALGDEDGAQLELDAARTTFQLLGAGPDVATIESLAERLPPGRRHCLTARELQVLRLVAAGKTNRAIAAELRLSEKTVDRHVSNILAKLDVPSRTAATAFACHHGLV
jgi:DNA-binding NarL/FixJ family response regulator